jgi:hypothetical protein
MNRPRLSLSGPLWIALALIGALLACTASLDSGEQNDPVNTGGGVVSGPAPVVRIVDPVSGARVPVDQRVDIIVETDTAATSFLLKVNGGVRSTKALPSGQSGPTQAILSWTPITQGTYTLEVVAYNGAAISAPVALILEVSGVVSAPTTPGQAGICTGRVLVTELNIRDGPNTSSAKLGQFAFSETVTVIGRNADTSWYKVQRPNAQQGWVINNAQWLAVEGDCMGLAVIE